jgi:hypothetical protein
MIEGKDRKYKLSNYPLAWPDGWARSKSYSRKSGHFKMHGNSASIMAGHGRVLAELSKMGISKDDVLISSDVPTRLDG